MGFNFKIKGFATGTNFTESHHFEFLIFHFSFPQGRTLPRIADGRKPTPIVRMAQINLLVS